MLLVSTNTRYAPERKEAAGVGPARSHGPARRGRSYGARLRAEFEERTGGTWPLNVGQVYTTLERLVRDGLVEPTGDPDPEGRIAYRLTPAGRAELDSLVDPPRRPPNTPATS